MRNNPANSKVREEGGETGAAGTAADSPVACGKDHVGADVHAAAHG